VAKRRCWNLILTQNLGDNVGHVMLERVRIAGLLTLQGVVSSCRDPNLNGGVVRTITVLEVVNRRSKPPLFDKIISMVPT
jgi:hypothetical protein